MSMPLSDPAFVVSYLAATYLSGVSLGVYSQRGATCRNSNAMITVGATAGVAVGLYGYALWRWYQIDCQERYTAFVRGINFDDTN